MQLFLHKMILNHGLLFIFQNSSICCFFVFKFLFEGWLIPRHSGTRTQVEKENRSALLIRPTPGVSSICCWKACFTMNLEMRIQVGKLWLSVHMENKFSPFCFQSSRRPDWPLWCSLLAAFPVDFEDIYGVQTPNNRK